MGHGLNWYEVIANGETGAAIDGSAVGTVERAELAVRLLVSLHPDAAIVFVRQHLRKGGVRLVRRLIWRKGMPMPQQVSRASWRTVKR